MPSGCSFGVGGSEIVAADAYHKFLRSPISVVHSADYHIQLMEAALLTPEDCALLISHTGKSKETIELAQVAKDCGAKVIVITSHAASPLAKLGMSYLFLFPKRSNFVQKLLLPESLN